MTIEEIHPRQIVISDGNRAHKCRVFSPATEITDPDTANQGRRSLQDIQKRRRAGAGRSVRSDHEPGTPPPGGCVLIDDAVFRLFRQASDFPPGTQDIPAIRPDENIRIGMARPRPPDPIVDLPAGHVR